MREFVIRPPSPPPGLAVDPRVVRLALRSFWALGLFFGLVGIQINDDDDDPHRFARWDDDGGPSLP